ncbi:hypothetical protein Tco_1283540 [Tanacetum coccineum]
MDRRLKNFEVLKLSMCHKTTLASDTLIDFQINFHLIGEIVTHWFTLIVLFNTTAGNPVKEILLKLNLPDHRSILTDSKIEVKRQSVKVKELREDASLQLLSYQIKKGMSMSVPKSQVLQDGKDYKMAEILGLVGDLQMLKIIFTFKLKSKECAPA